eukprot:6392152-Amphidinium_carterae.1
MQRYQDLCTVSTLEGKASLFEACDSMDGVKNLWAEINPLMQRMKELFSAQRTNLSAMEAVYKSSQKAKKGEEKEE